MPLVHPARFSHLPSHRLLRSLLCVVVLQYTYSLVLPSTPRSPHTLHEAAAEGDADTAAMLLFAGESSEARNAKASTPLHLAAFKGHDAVAQVLLDYGAATDAVNEDGMTPLHAAVKARQLRVAELLLARGAEAEKTSKSGLRPLSIAARQGDSAMLSMLLEAGARMDEQTADAAFWAAVAAVEAASEDEPLSAEVPRLLHQVFDADMQLLLSRDKLATNVTCQQPAEHGVLAAAEGMKYIFDRDEHANLPLREGRRCDGGSCCDACSRVTFPSFALPAETDLEMFPQLEDFSFNACGTSATATILNFCRLVERMRRSIAHEYGLSLSTVLPLQAYSRPYRDESVVPLHTDEATHASYHYSCVLYLTTQNEDFEGGSFLWNDPAAEGEAVQADAAADAARAELSTARAEFQAAEKRWRGLEFGNQETEELEFGGGPGGDDRELREETEARYREPCTLTLSPDIQQPTHRKPRRGTGSHARGTTRRRRRLRPPARARAAA